MRAVPPHKTPRGPLPPHRAGDPRPSAWRACRHERDQAGHRCGPSASRPIGQEASTEPVQTYRSIASWGSTLHGPIWLSNKRGPPTRPCSTVESPRGPNRAGLHLPSEALTYQANRDAIDEPADWILGPFSAGPRAGEDRITEPSVGTSSDDLVPVVVPVVQRNAIKSRLYQSINGSSLSVMDSKVPPIPRHADVEADPGVLARFNSAVIEEFRANAGVVGGPFENSAVMLLTTTGAKSGQQRMTPVEYFRVDDRVIFVALAVAPRPTRPGSTT
jgi:F420H(2)-dependent quinone reductase